MIGCSFASFARFRIVPSFAIRARTQFAPEFRCGWFSLFHCLKRRRCRKPNGTIVVNQAVPQKKPPKLVAAEVTRQSFKSNALLHSASPARRLQPCYWVFCSRVVVSWPEHAFLADADEAAARPIEVKIPTRSKGHVALKASKMPSPILMPPV